MTASTDPPEPTGRPLTPGEALRNLFLDNADNGRNAANDELVAALLQRAREIQTLAEPPTSTTYLNAEIGGDSRP